MPDGGVDAFDVGVDFWGRHLEKRDLRMRMRMEVGSEGEETSQRGADGLTRHGPISI